MFHIYGVNTASVAGRDPDPDLDPDPAGGDWNKTASLGKQMSY